MKSLAYALLGLVLWGGWSAHAAEDGCRNPAEDADVIFDAKALGTEGTTTRMQVLRVSRGQISGQKILFKHLAKTELKKDELYRIFAKQAADAKSYSQLWGIPYCSETVLRIER